MGLKAAMISISQDAGQGYENPIHDPIWSASEDLEMPISLHVAASKKHFSHTTNMLADFSLAFTPTMYSLAAMIFSGVFDRHPKLKVVSVENDAAWVAGILERMDYRMHRDQGWAGLFQRHHLGPHSQPDLSRTRGRHLHARPHRGAQPRYHRPVAA